MDDREAAFFEVMFGKGYAQKQRDAAEFAARQDAGKHNIFDEFFGRSSAEEQARQETYSKKKYNFYKWKDPKEDHFGHHEGVHPDPYVHFIEVSYDGYDYSLHQIKEAIKRRLRSDVRVIMTYDNRIRLERRFPKPDPNKIVERVLSKDEVTVAVCHPINP